MKKIFAYIILGPLLIGGGGLFLFALMPLEQIAGLTMVLGLLILLPIIIIGLSIYSYIKSKKFLRSLWILAVYSILVLTLALDIDAHKLGPLIIKQIGIIFIIVVISDLLIYAYQQRSKPIQKRK